MSGTTVMVMQLKDCLISRKSQKLVRGKPEAERLHRQKTPSLLGARKGSCHGGEQGFLPWWRAVPGWRYRLYQRHTTPQQRAIFLTSEISDPSCWPRHGAAIPSGPKQH